MKKLLFLFLMLKCLSSLNAQSIDSLPWCPPGATWVYSKTFFGNTGYYILKYINDTTIQNRQVKKLEYRYQSYLVLVGDTVRPYRLQYDTLLNYEFLTKSQDTVFRYNPTTINFDVLYIFGQIGDGWMVQPDSLYVCSNSILTGNYIEIIAERNVTMGNHTFRRIGLSATPDWELGANILHNIGPNITPFPIPTQTNCSNSDNRLPPPEALECYVDSLRGYITYQGMPCSMLTTVERIGDNASHVNYTPYLLYPNPTSTLLYLSLGLNPPKLRAYEIRNGLGQLVLQAQDDFPQEGLSTSTLPSGVYFLTIYSQFNNQISTLKFIKK